MVHFTHNPSSLNATLARVPSWVEKKSGDKTSWEEQMRIRAQAQDEYAKTK